MKDKLRYRTFVSVVAVFSIAVISMLAPEPIEAITYGDYVTDPTQFPEVVSIWEYDDFSYEYQFICSGTLISQLDVLTAAHCVRNSGDLLVEIGAFNLGDGSNRFVVGKWYHPRYSDRFIANDVGVLRLAEPANVLRVAQLPKMNWKPGRATRYSMVGWGDDQNEDTGKLRVLDSVPLDSYARSYWKSLFNPKTTLSAGKYFKNERLFGGACSGDSGGPLFLKSKTSRKVVVGITSWGARDCESFAPSVFSSTSYALTEIRKGIQQLDGETVIEKTPIQVSAIQTSSDRFTPSFQISTANTPGSLIKLICFSINGNDTNQGIRGLLMLPYTIPNDGCTWTSSNSVAFRILSWESTSGTNTVSVFVLDQQNRQSEVVFSLCKGPYYLDLCSGFSYS